MSAVMARLALISGLSPTVALWALAAVAQSPKPTPPPPAVRPVAAVAQAGAGQPALAVGFDASARLFAKVCAEQSCTPSGGEELVLRSEEHTSELQSQSNLVCRLLLEKKKKEAL